MRERKPKLLESEELWAYGVRALAARAHSIGELREKLRRRAAKTGDVDAVLSRLKELGYLDDKRYAESFAASRLSNDSFGKTRVIQDLRQRRVAPTVAETAVKGVYRDVDEQALIEDWVRRKYRTASRENLFQDDKEMASAYRRLLRAGFRAGDIVRVLKRFARNPDLLDEWEPPVDEGGES